MHRLVFFVVGAWKEYRRQAIKGEYAVRLRVLDDFRVRRFGQWFVIGFCVSPGERQFSEEDIRFNFALKIFDHRIHFALNCGGLSCPPIVSYQAELIHEQLNWAEENFGHSEFLIDHGLKQITCSSIFVWYRNDFVETYLNDLHLTDYLVIEKEYNWNFRN